MNEQRLFRNISLLILITVVGLGLGLVLPWLGMLQVKAAQSEPQPPAEAPLATRFYVSKSGDGTDGRTWNKAFTGVQDALFVASSGDEIWVAAGIYTTPLTLDERSFILVSGVAMYGGFRGVETQRSQRDWVANPTILSGDIDGDDITTDGVVMTTTHINGSNSYHVVIAYGTDGTPITETTILDGFTITAGDARSGSFTGKMGGGFFCDGSGDGSECSPSLKNIIFSGNHALNSGGGMENYCYFHGISSPELKDVKFSGNSSGTFGGALSNDAQTCTSSPSLTGVEFSGNSADYGGAISNDAFEGGTSNPILQGVIFSGNKANVQGGAMLIRASFGSTSTPSLSAVNFINNSADIGGAIYNSADFDYSFSNPSMVDIIFSANSAGSLGGAIYNNAGSNSTSSPSLNKVIFIGNSADFGGAVYNQAWFNSTCRPSLTNVLLSGNSADSSGGAIYNETNNNGEINPTMLHVTISGNSAGLSGGGIFNSGNPGGKNEPDLRNSIVWNNKDGMGAGSLTANIYNNSASAMIYHSLLQGAGASGGGWTSDPSYVDGGGNIDKDPRFLVPVDPSTAPTTAGNMRLMPRSPAIDSGKNSYSAGVLVDLDGDIRPADGDLDGNLVVDMGAYERQNYTYLPGVVIRN